MLVRSNARSACAVLTSLTVKILATVAVLGGALHVKKMESRPKKHKLFSKPSGLKGEFIYLNFAHLGEYIRRSPGQEIAVFKSNRACDRRNTVRCPIIGQPLRK